MSKEEKGIPAIETSWAKLGDEWGVRIYGTEEDLKGRLVEVTTKSGTASQVILGEIIEERGQARIYSVAGRP